MKKHLCVLCAVCAQLKHLRSLADYCFFHRNNEGLFYRLTLTVL